MILLILAIATIIGLVVSLSKAIRFLRNEEIKLAKTWGLIALTIISVFMIFAWLYKKIKGTDNQILISGNLGNTFTSIWKEGDYVRVKLLDETGLLITRNVYGVKQIPFKTKEISGYITTPTSSVNDDIKMVDYMQVYHLTVIGPNGVDKGDTYIIPKSEVLSITKEKVPVEG